MGLCAQRSRSISGSVFTPAARKSAAKKGGGGSNEDELLASCYRVALDLDNDAQTDPIACRHGEVALRALARRDRADPAAYAEGGRPSIPPEKLLRAQFLQMLYSVRSERLLMEEIDYSILYRWFVGLNLDEAVTKN